MNDENILVVVLTSLVSIATMIEIIVQKLSKTKSSLDGIRPHDPITIGVVDAVPKCLASLPRFDNLRMARKSGEPIVLIFCHRLSYALRKCDYVVGDTDDPKIYSLDDPFWEHLIGNKI